MKRPPSRDENRHAQHADPTDPATDAELAAYVGEHLARYKTPASWYRVDEFPLTASGKVQKFAIVDAWEKGLYDPG